MSSFDRRALRTIRYGILQAHPACGDAVAADGVLMTDPVFFTVPEPMTIERLAEIGGGRVVRGDPGLFVASVAPLDEAGPSHLSFIDNPRYLGQLAETRAAAVFCPPKFVDRVPEATAVIEARQSYRAFAKATAALYPEAMRPVGVIRGSGISPAAHVDPSATLEDGVVVEAGAVVGPRVEIGAGTVIAATAVVGAGVRIGRHGYIGAGAVVQHALVGDRVIIHPGVRIGQDGFGFAMGPGGHLKVPQIGRVVVQNDVEIGANTTIDRGANRDTIIGEGTKIDNQVQIGHNVVVGRHCVIVSQVGISGSTVLEDYVVLAGKVGLSGHLKLGTGAQVGGGSNVAHDIPAGERWMGTPAQPIREWTQEKRVVAELAKARRTRDTKDEEPTR